MKGKCIAVCVVAGVFGLIAIILGFTAEGTRIKDDKVMYTEDGECIYPKSPSMALGIVGAIILLIEQILISAASGCFCCRPNPCPSTCRGITAVVCFIFSWLVFIGAIVTMLMGAVINNADALGKKYTIDDGCPVGKLGLFIVAAVLSFVCVALGLISYIALMSSDNKTVSKGVNEHGIATVKPDFPAK